MFKYLQILTVVFSTCSGSVCFADSKVTQSTRPVQEYSDIIEEYRSSIPDIMKKENIPGVSVAIVDNDGIIWSEGFGYTDLEKTNPVTDETLFSIQSMSKTFTATAVLLAVQDGLLDLDTPISRYLPDFKVNSVYDENPQDKITLRHLLSHTAGFDHEAPVGNNHNAESPSFEAHVKSISDTWLMIPVGQRYRYSNLGIDLAGYILQTVSGTSFEQYMKDRLFDPLGMTDSSIDLNVIEKTENRALGHNRGVIDTRPLIPMTGAGGVYTSAKELAKFVQFQLNKGEINGKEILDESLINEMYTIQFPKERQTQGYGLGISRRDEYGTYYMMHGGGGFGFLTRMKWFPEIGIGGVFLTNSTGHNAVNTIPPKIIMKAIIAKTGALDETPAPLFFKNRVPVTLDPEKMKILEGSYMGKGMGILSIKLVGDNLGFQNGDEFDEFIFYSDTDFCYGEDKQHCRFILKPDGSPSCLINLENGTTLDYNYGPYDAFGPDKAEWESYTGVYAVKLSGKTLAKFDIYKENGYLFLKMGSAVNSLQEYRPGLFFTVNGESVDFNNSLVQSIFKLEKI